MEEIHELQKQHNEFMQRISNIKAEITSLRDEIQATENQLMCLVEQRNSSSSMYNDYVIPPPDHYSIKNKHD